jgi:DNA repair protein RecO (recombination protein O)
MTREHGRHLGLVRGGTGRRLRPVLQAGNGVRAIWQARLDEHLGLYTVEGIDLRAAALLPVSYALYGMIHLAELCRLLPERDPHPRVHAELTSLVRDLLDLRAAACGLVRFERLLLAELGFGLDLESCAATGTTTDLAYVSPKSGRAVSRRAGEPWKEKLLPLPEFLHALDAGEPSVEDISAGFDLTGFFLLRHALNPRGLQLPEARGSFIAALLNSTTCRPAIAG